MIFTKTFRLGGTHHKTLVIDPLRENDSIVLDFSMVDVDTVVIKDTVYHRSDHPTKLPKGCFTTRNGKLLVHLDREKVVRPIVTVTYRQKENIETNNIAKLKRRSPARSHLFVKNRVKNKISWGCSPCKIQGIDTTRTIPSKLGKIHFDGTMFILNNRAIAVIEKDTIVPKVDILTKDGEYLYNRVMSIFELSHVKTRYGLLHTENNLIYLNKVHVASVINGDIVPSKTQNKLYEKVKTEVVRMINLDETLDYVSPKKTNIKADLL